MTTALLKRLARRIEEIQASERPFARGAVRLDMPALEDVFPDRCLPAGALVELLPAARGSGAWTLALLMAQRACERKLLVIADAERSFYPPAVARLGIDLGRTLVIRTPVRAHVLAALVQSLRSAAVGAVIGSFERLNATEYRRLQLAAEAAGSVGFLLRPATVRNAPSFAAVRLLITPMTSTSTRQRIQVEVLRLRGARSGSSFLLEIDHETGHVCVPAPLAPAVAAARPARAAR